jgi:hypothetical protein
MEDTGIFGLNPSTMAIVVIVVLLMLWTAYTWFYGGVTVPLPSYAIGFRGSEGFRKVGFVDSSGSMQGFRNSVGLGSAQGFVDSSGSVQGFVDSSGSIQGFVDSSGSVQGFLNSVGLGFPQGFVDSSGSVQGFVDSSGSMQGFQVPKFVKKEEGFRNGLEGFGGIAHGAGSPSCLRSSAEGAQLIDMFQKKNPLFEEGPDALRELTVLVGKLSCFKKDLVSPSYIVNATRMQPYSTTHDIEPVAETTARCFAKTISPRDLGISLDKWTSRGELLVKKLCTSYSLKQAEVEKAQGLFRSVIRDVSDIARSSCLAGEPSIAGNPGPRDAHPYEKETDFGTYTGYY